MSDANPLVSVILPVYNGAEFVACALESVLRQTYRNLEVLAVNDGSTDGTQAVLEEFAARDPRLRVIQQPNSGVARARNQALAEANGEFIAPIDADDLWAPDKIDRQVRRMQRAGEDVGFVYCAWVWIDPAGRVLDRSPHWDIEGDALKPLIFLNFTGNASVPLFRRRCLEEIGGYNESLAREKAGGCEDWEVVLRIAATHPIAVAPDVLLGYRRSPGSMSSACDTMWRSQQRVMHRLQAEHPELPPALFRASENQFSMYLAGVAYWSGNLRAAVRWGLRTGLRLPLKVAPFVLKMLLFPRKSSHAQIMQPGTRLDRARIPDPLLPDNLLGSVSDFLESLFLGPLLQVLLRVRQGLVRLRLRGEQWKSAMRQGEHRPRVWAMGCPEFPIYSHTFVYRELHGLVLAGFEVRLAYRQRALRKDLADDAAGLWTVRRWVPYTRVNGDFDLAWCQRRSPARFDQVVRQIAAATGMEDFEVREHRDFRYACSFTRMAYAWGAEYIHTYFFYEQALCGLVAATLLDLPRGVSCYADHMMEDYALKMVRLHMETSEVVVATSARIKAELEAIAGKPLPGAVVKPNGIDSRHYRAAPRPPAGSQRAFRLVAVNRIHPKKGVQYLLEAAMLLRDRGRTLVVDILGEPEASEQASLRYAEEVRKYAAEQALDDLVVFHGRQTAAQVRDRLALADVFVAPFVELENGDKDGVPTALLEAMASGCAVVVTDAGSIPEVITHEVDGLVVPQRDAIALAAAIERLAADDALRARLAAAGRNRVEQRFDMRRCEGAFHERVRQALATRDPFRFPEDSAFRPGALKIALISYEYPPDTGFGGIGSYTWYQARALVRLGHRVHVLAGARELTLPRLARSRHDGVTVFRTASRGRARIVAAVFGLLRCYWTRSRSQNAIGMDEAFRLLHDRYDYDLVEAPECGADASLIATRSTVPSVIRLHGPARFVMQYYKASPPDRLLCSWIEQRGLRGATAVNSCSRFLAEEAMARLGITRLGLAQPVETIYNGLDLALFDAEPAADLAALYDLPPGKLTILFAGRMEQRKGIELCARIVELVLQRHEATFLFAGDDLFGYLQGTMLPQLAARGLTGSVRYLGKLNFQQVRAAAKAVDLYLLPSLWENCPYACMEAMAAARAVVCSRQGGMPELIEHGTNGMLAETGSPESFAELLCTLIEDPALRQQLGAAARRTIEERFTDTEMALQTEAFYRRVLAASGPRPRGRA